MRILPSLNTQRSFVNNTNNTSAKLNVVGNINQNKSHIHNYTGVASSDLAYASMFDNAIARDLKLMGLI